METQHLIRVSPDPIVIKTFDCFLQLYNGSSDTIHNCSFDLFNRQKYAFQPQSFDLLPSKALNVCIKLKYLPNYTRQPFQDFVYLKAKNYQKKLLIKLHSQLWNHPKNGMVIQRHFNNGTVASKIRKLQPQNQENKNAQSLNSTHKKLSSQDLSLETNPEKLKRLHLKELKGLKQEILNLNIEKQALYRQNICLQKEIEELIAEQNQRQLRSAFCDENVRNDLIQEKNKMIQGKLKQIQFLTYQNQELKELIFSHQNQMQGLRQETTFLVAQKDKQINDISKIYGNKLKIIEQLQADNRNLRVITQEVQKMLKDQQYEIDNLKDKLNQYQTKQFDLKTLQNQNIELKVTKDQLEHQNEMLNEHLKQIEGREKDLRDKLAETKGQLDSLKKSNEKEGKRLEQQIQKLTNDRDGLKNINQQLQTDQKHSQEGTDNFKNKNLQLEKQIKALRQLLDRLKDDYHTKQTEMRANINNLEKQLLSKAHQLDNAKLQNQDTASELDALKEFSQKQNKQLTHLKQQIQQANEKNGENNKKLKEQQDLLDKLEDSLKEKEKQFYKLKKLYSGQLEGMSQCQNRNNQSQFRKRKIKSQVEEQNVQKSQDFVDQKLDIDGLLDELHRAKEFKDKVDEKMCEMGDKLGVKVTRLGDHRPPPLNSENQRNPDAFSIVNFFNKLDKKITEDLCEKNKFDQANKQLQFLRGRLRELEALRDEFMRKKEENKLNAEERSILDFMREEMKKQHKNMYDSIKMHQQKFETLKKNIYEEYRIKILELVNKKDKTKIGQIQLVLQRFVEGLANTSHKEAIMAKQIKLKNEARKQIHHLKEKINSMSNKQEGNKQNAKQESPVQNQKIEREAEYLQLIKQEALAVSYHTENSRLKSELQNIRQIDRKYQEETNRLQQDIIDKEEEIIGLKKQIIEIENKTDLQLQQRQFQLEQLKKKYLKSKENEADKGEIKKLHKNISSLQEQLQAKTKKQDQLQEKIKSLQKAESHAQQLQNALKDSQIAQKKDISRKQAVIKEFKTAANKLKEQNQKLKNQLEMLNKENNKKKLAIKELSSKVNQLKATLKANKLIANQRNDIDSDKLIKSEESIADKISKGGLESKIKNLLQIIKSSYLRIHCMMLKKNQGTSVGLTKEQVEEFTKLVEWQKVGQIDCLKIDEYMSSIIEFLEKITEK